MGYKRVGGGVKLSVIIQGGSAPKSIVGFYDRFLSDMKCSRVMCGPHMCRKDDVIKNPPAISIQCPGIIPDHSTKITSENVLKWVSPVRTFA